MTGPCASTRLPRPGWIILTLPSSRFRRWSRFEERVPCQSRDPNHPLMERYDVPGVALALVVARRVVWSDAFGLADVEVGRAMTVEAVSRAESISKSVTAWGVMTLVEAGALALDDPVAEHIGSLPPPVGEIAPEITVRHLLSHTSASDGNDV